MVHGHGGRGFNSSSCESRTGTRRDSASLAQAQAQAMHNFPMDGRDLRPGSEQGVLRHGAVGLPGERMVRRSGDEDITKCHYKHKHKHQ